MLKFAIIIGSTRPTRVGDQVGLWAYENLKDNGDIELELIDLKDFNLPLLDEPAPAGSSSDYKHEHTRRWSQKISEFDGYIFVTPEYNHSIPASLKNALDYLYKEWTNKVAGFIAYGSSNGIRAVESLRLICAELQMPTVRNQVALSLRSDFENYTKFKPADYHTKTLSHVLDDMMSWGVAMKNIRRPDLDISDKRIDERISNNQSSIH